MNQTIELLKTHRSIRHFIANKPLSDAQLQEIIACAKQAPTWMNGQHYSIIVITDPQTKAMLAQWSPRNAHIEHSSAFLIFCADFTHLAQASALHQQLFDISDNHDALITASMDAALAMQNAIIAAESMSLGTVCVGAIRQIADNIINLYHLPQLSYPLCGLSIGYPDNQPTSIKPRLSDAVNVGYNQYPRTAINHIMAYKQILPEWGQKLSKYYASQPLIETNKLLKKQGF